MAQMRGLRERARCTQTGECRQLCLKHGTGQGRGVESQKGFLRWEDADRDKRRQYEGRGGDIRSLGRWVVGPEPCEAWPVSLTCP